MANRKRGIELPEQPWIPRTLEPLLTAPPASLGLFPVWLILGPRQVGKSSLLARCGAERQYVNLDDLATRARALADPALFSRELQTRCILDEIQYAPSLLSTVKVMADRHPEAGSIWLTGSHSFDVIQGVRESLAGRVAIINLYGLSDEEAGVGAHDPRAYFASIVASSMPRLHRVSESDARALYLSSYVQTYIERDVRELIGLSKRREFEQFVRACALRTAQIVNYADLGRDCGISPVTARDWLGVLEDSYLIRLVQPWHANRSKRLIKSPKLYFLDMGLAAWLAGWRDPEMLRLGPMAGAAFETHIFGQILRWFRHRVREVQIHFWRTRDGQEIDFLVETADAIYPVEVKLGLPNPRTLVPVAALGESRFGPGRVISLAQAPGAPALIHEDWTISSPADLGRWSNRRSDGDK